MAVGSGDSCILVQTADGRVVPFGPARVAADADPCILAQTADGKIVPLAFSQTGVDNLALPASRPYAQQASNSQDPADTFYGPAVAFSEGTTVELTEGALYLGYWRPGRYFYDVTGLAIKMRFNGYVDIAHQVATYMQLLDASDNVLLECDIHHSSMSLSNAWWDDGVCEAHQFSYFAADSGVGLSLNGQGLYGLCQMTGTATKWRLKYTYSGNAGESISTAVFTTNVASMSAFTACDSGLTAYPGESSAGVGARGVLAAAADGKLVLVTPTVSLGGAITSVEEWTAKDISIAGKTWCARRYSDWFSLSTPIPLIPVSGWVPRNLVVWYSTTGDTGVDISTVGLPQYSFAWGIGASSGSSWGSPPSGVQLVFSSDDETFQMMGELGAIRAYPVCPGFSPYTARCGDSWMRFWTPAQHVVSLLGPSNRSTPVSLTKARLAATSWNTESSNDRNETMTIAFGPDGGPVVFHAFTAGAI